MAIAPNYWSFESLTNAIGQPLTVNPMFTWMCGCLANLIPGTNDSLMVTPCTKHQRQIIGDDAE